MVIVFKVAFDSTSLDLLYDLSDFYSVTQMYI